MTEELETRVELERRMLAGTSNYYDRHYALGVIMSSPAQANNQAAVPLLREGSYHTRYNIYIRHR